MTSKIPIGTDFFDQRYGGVYSNRGVLVTGQSGSGKTVLGLQFVVHGLQLGQRCLMLSAQPANDLAIFAQALGFSGVAGAIADGSLCFLEYSDYVPGRDREENITLPPEGFQQLQQVIESNGIQRVVLDTVLPWVCLPTQEHLAEHIFSFVRAFERMGTTALFTIPKPVSASAIRLRRHIEDIVPISITLNTAVDSTPRTWVVNKYLGAEQVETKFDFVIRQDKGIIQAEPAPARVGNVSFAPGQPPAAKAANRPISFSEVMLKDSRPGRREPQGRRPDDDGGHSFSL